MIFQNGRAFWRSPCTSSLLKFIFESINEFKIPKPGELLDRMLNKTFERKFLRQYSLWLNSFKRWLIGQERRTHDIVLIFYTLTYKKRYARKISNLDIYFGEIMKNLVKNFK